MAKSSGGEIIDLLLRLNGRQHNQKTDELIKAFEFDPKKSSYLFKKAIVKSSVNSLRCRKMPICIF